ncbi:MAG TPA: tetratricopeptide repeat protein, partial [bacterium]|nr:tetratricopeptide repeat protein [bacterium]
MAAKKQAAHAAPERVSPARPHGAPLKTADGPASPKAYEHFCRAKLALENNEIPQAIDEYSKAIVYDPESAYLYTELAATYYRNSDAHHAEDAARKA